MAVTYASFLQCAVGHIPNMTSPPKTDFRCRNDGLRWRIVFIWNVERRNVPMRIQGSAQSQRDIVGILLLECPGMKRSVGYKAESNGGSDYIPLSPFLIDYTHNLLIHEDVLYSHRQHCRDPPGRMLRHSR